MGSRVRRSAGRALTHQLVVLPARGEGGTAVTCALDEARDGRAVDVRDAAVLTVRAPEVCVTEPSDDWPGRHRLGSRWWTALAGALRDVGGCSHADDHPESCFRHLVEAGMSRSFLEEAAMALAASSTTVLLLADRHRRPIVAAQAGERRLHASDLRLVARRRCRRAGHRRRVVASAHERAPRDHGGRGGQREVAPATDALVEGVGGHRRDPAAHRRPQPAGVATSC